MPGIKKQVRSHVRRAARLVIQRYYEKENIHRPKKTINDLVKEVERRTVPALVGTLKEKSRNLP